MKNIGIALAASLVLVACGGGSTGSPSPDLQSARAVRPASCTYAHVWVTVTAIRVLRDDAGVEQWQDIALASPQRIDLLAAGSGLLQALGAAPLHTGHYTQVRLMLASDGNTVQPTGGAESALSVPSGTSSGLKLTGDITVAAGSTADVGLDGFDPCAAIVVTGSGAYALKPQAVVTMTAVQAGPEVPGPAGLVVPSPSGGWALVSQAGAFQPFTLQRFDASGNPAGTISGINTGDNFITSFAALAGGGYAAVWLNYYSLDADQVMTQAWDAAGHALSSPTAVALVHPGDLPHPAAVPKIAPLIGGGYVLVWGLPPGESGIYAQRFAASGVPAAPAVRATDSGTGSLGVAGLASGGYLVSWGRFDSPSGGVRAYSADDEPVGPVRSAGSNGDGGGPPIPVLQGLQGGGAVIAWQALREHVLVQQVAADGAPVTDAQVVDDQTPSPLFASIAIGALPDGGSVIAWIDNGDVYARRYLASGAPAGPQTKINVVTTSASGPMWGVAVRADGSFEVHWNGTGADGVRRWYVRTFPANALTA